MTLHEQARAEFIKKWQAKYEIHPSDLMGIWEDIASLITQAAQAMKEKCLASLPENRGLAKHVLGSEFLNGWNGCTSEAHKNLSAINVEDL